MLLEKIKRNFGILDFGTILTMLVLISIGLVSIYSATAGQNGGFSSNNFERQIYWFGVGLALLLITVSINPRVYQALAYLIYGIIIIALAAVLIKGVSGGGATRWLSIVGFRFQPSEWAKIVTIFALARYLTENHENVNDKRHLLIMACMGLLPVLLIFKQPDLGTALVLLAIIPSMMYWAGVSPLILFLTFMPALTMIASFNLWTFFGVMCVLLFVLIIVKKSLLFSFGHMVANVIVGIMTPFFWNSLESYQQKRALSFLGILSDPKGVSYQVIQSKVAIGSGGISGKGFMAGTQTQLRFLPEQHTDFIFSVIGEEFGILGSITVIVLFVLLLSRGIQLASNLKNRFMSLVSIGITTMLFYHYLVNLGMVMGIMPVTGLPLPFVSYGGTFLVTCMIAVGLLVSCSINRHEY